MGKDTENAYFFGVAESEAGGGDGGRTKQHDSQRPSEEGEDQEIMENQWSAEHGPIHEEVVETSALVTSSVGTENARKKDSDLIERTAPAMPPPAVQSSIGTSTLSKLRSENKVSGSTEKKTTRETSAVKRKREALTVDDNESVGETETLSRKKKNKNSDENREKKKNEDTCLLTEAEETLTLTDSDKEEESGDDDVLLISQREKRILFPEDEEDESTVEYWDEDGEEEDEDRSPVTSFSAILQAAMDAIETADVSEDEEDTLPEEIDETETRKFGHKSGCRALFFNLLDKNYIYMAILLNCIFPSSDSHFYGKHKQQRKTTLLKLSWTSMSPCGSLRTQLKSLSSKRDGPWAAGEMKTMMQSRKQTGKNG